MTNAEYRRLKEEDPLHDTDYDKEQKERKQSRCKMALKVTAVLTIVVVIFAIVVPCAIALGFGGPLHASCKINWEFPSMNCSNVNSKLVKQINKWGSDDCGNGEKCLYKLVSSTDTELKATHETPVKHYVDDLSFTFAPSGKMCNVKGFSTSETWYAVLDYGTNYCNLHNLITGSGLNETVGFVEDTNDDICTQYSSADCEKY